MNHHSSLHSSCTTTEKNTQFLLKMNWNNSYVNRTEEPAALRQGSVMLQKYVKGRKILTVFGSFSPFPPHSPLSELLVLCWSCSNFTTVWNLGDLLSMDTWPPPSCPTNAPCFIALKMQGTCTFSHMRKWSTKQGRTTSEKPCSDSRTQEHSFMDSKSGLWLGYCWTASLSKPLWLPCFLT